MFRMVALSRTLQRWCAESTDDGFWLKRCLTAVNLGNLEALPLVWTPQQSVQRRY